MNVYDAIHSRRSIRSFKSDPIDESVIERIMNSAIMAPSALNSQNWKFYVLTGESRDKFAKLLLPVFERMKDKILQQYGHEAVEVRRKLYTNAGGAPVVIVCYAEKGEWDWDPIGPAMACQNILLAAKSEGLGSLFIGSPKYEKESVNKLLNESDSILTGAILVGYPDENPSPKPRRDGVIVRLK
jgi:nitroreductase